MYTFCDNWGGFVFGTDRQTDRAFLVAAVGKVLCAQPVVLVCYLSLQWQFNLLLEPIVGQRNRVSDVCTN